MSLASNPLPEGAPPVQPEEPAARIPRRSTSELTPAMQATLAAIPGAGLKGEAFPHEVIGQLLHSPELLESFLVWWVQGKSGLSLTAREQELVILRVGCHYASNYVWKHHVHVGRECGITPSELANLRAGTLEAFEPREHTLLALTDELVQQRRVRPEIWSRHGTALEPRLLVDLIALISQYVLFALINNVLQVPLEPLLAAEPGLEG